MTDIMQSKAEKLVVTDAVKSYDSKNTILSSLSFEVEKGEFVVLVGPSGCGKSTMLRSIAGLEELDSGQLTLGNRDITKAAPKDRNIAMVFQDYALYPHKTVYENMAFGLRVRKLPKDEIHLRVMEAADKLNLNKLLDRKPSEISGGQRQRVAIGRAIVRKPALFLFDEPLSNLDAKLRSKMRLTIARLHQELKATALYVTHDQVEAMTLADRIIVLNKGHIQQIGSPLQLFHHPSNLFVAGFIGSPSMNLLEGELYLKDGKACFRSDSGFDHIFQDQFQQLILKKASRYKKVVLGLRPENLKMGESENGENNHNVKIIVSEPLGTESILFAQVGGHEMRLRVQEPHRPKAGDEFVMHFKSRHIYLFDQETEESLVLGVHD